MKINLETEDRINLVKNIFDRIAPRYDLFNHLASLGRDVYWRKTTAGRTRVFSTNRVLDLAAGTCDLALAIADARPGANVIATDFVFNMLSLGRKKIINSKNASQITLSAADALKLPFPEESFDSTTIAFGIRNIPDKIGALKEMHRVLAPGGRALILELGLPRALWFKRFYDQYLNRLIPKLGRLISKNPAAYQYLVDSIMDFPKPEEFQVLMAQAGFDETGFKKLTLGIAVLFWADKKP